MKDVDIERCQRRKGKGRCTGTFSLYETMTPEITEAIAQGKIPQAPHAGSPGELICADCFAADQKRASR